jgi:lipopolysaccharide/colanic/teichoic acid biosynthesis glycosyltransferase
MSAPIDQTDDAMLAAGPITVPGRTVPVSDPPLVEVEVRPIQPPAPLAEPAAAIDRRTALTTEVLLVTRNSRAELGRSLPAIRKAAALANAPLLFIDLGSTDGTQEYAAGHAPGARAASLEAGDGLADALHTALACSDADVLVLLRPALEPAAPNAIVRLVRHLDTHPYVAAAAPALRSMTGSVLRSARPEPTRAEHAPVEWVLQDAIAIRRADLAAVAEGPQAPLDELELCVRLRRIGREIHYLRFVQWLDATGRTTSRAERAARVSFAAWRLLVRHPGYALRLAGRRAALSRAYRLASRALDIVLAGAMLTLLAPLLLAIAIAIRIDSPGPSLFRQRRLGREAHPFDMYKFRTMRLDADSAPHAQFVHRMIASRAVSDAADEPQIFKLHPDPRVTRVGRLLRRSSFDELPQLFNVLRGEMTLVGFRPPIPYEVSSYPPWYFRRFNGKPGLTGLWQVSGRNQRSYEEMVRLDIEYANRRSWLLDMMVLVRTIGAVVSGRGAY